MSTSFDLASVFTQRLSQDVNIGIDGLHIICRSSDGYINATQLCKAHGKQYNHWKENQKTQVFISELSMSTGIPGNTLVKYEMNGSTDRATWVHPEIAIDISYWISPKFARKVTKWIHELLVMGSVTYGKERSPDQIMQEQLTQLKNTIDQQVTVIKYKDDKIDELQASIQRLIQQNEESTKRLEELVKSSHKELIETKQEVVETKQEVVKTKQEVVKTKQEVVKTKQILNEIALRAVPIVANTDLYEVLLIYLVKDINSKVFTNKMIMRGVQKRGRDSAESKMRSAYGYGNFKLVKEYDCTPNVILLKGLIRELKDIAIVKNSNITLLNGIRVDQFIDAVDILHSDKHSDINFP